MNKKMKLIAGFVFTFTVTICLISLKSEPESQNFLPVNTEQKIKTQTVVVVPDKQTIPNGSVKESIQNNDPNERIKIALERFETEQAKIPPGGVAQELAAIKKKTAELEKIETPLPTIAPEVDEYGTKWNKLTYSTGDIRYELAE